MTHATETVRDSRTWAERIADATIEHQRGHGCNARYIRASAPELSRAYLFTIARTVGASEVLATKNVDYVRGMVARRAVARNAAGILAARVARGGARSPQGTTWPRTRRGVPAHLRNRFAGYMIDVYRLPLATVNGELCNVYMSAFLAVADVDGRVSELFAPWLETLGVPVDDSPRAWGARDGVSIVQAPNAEQLAHATESRRRAWADAVGGSLVPVLTFDAYSWPATGREGGTKPADLARYRMTVGDVTGRSTWDAPAVSVDLIARAHPDVEWWAGPVNDYGKRCIVATLDGNPVGTFLVASTAATVSR